MTKRRTRKKYKKKPVNMKMAFKGIRRLGKPTGGALKKAGQAIAKGPSFKKKTKKTEMVKIGRFV